MKISFFDLIFSYFSFVETVISIDGLYFIVNSSVGSILNCNIFAEDLHLSPHFLCIVILPIFMLHLGEISISPFQ